MGDRARLRAVLAVGGLLVVAVPFHPSAAFCRREERWIRHGMSRLFQDGTIPAVMGKARKSLNQLVVVLVVTQATGKLGTLPDST